MSKTLALIIGAAALGLAVQTFAQAVRREPAVAPAAVREDEASGPAERAEKSRSARTPQFHGLLAASETEVKTRLGAPDLARAEGSGAMWTYRLPDCALFVFFRRPAGEPLKVSGAASGPRMRGRNPPPVNECLSQGFERRVAEAAKPLR